MEHLPGSRFGGRIPGASVMVRLDIRVRAAPRRRACTVLRFLCPRPVMPPPPCRSLVVAWMRPSPVPRVWCGGVRRSRVLRTRAPRPGACRKGLRRIVRTRLSRVLPGAVHGRTHLLRRLRSGVERVWILRVAVPIGRNCHSRGGSLSDASAFATRRKPASRRHPGEGEKPLALHLSDAWKRLRSARTLAFPPVRNRAEPSRLHHLLLVESGPGMLASRGHDRSAPDSCSSGTHSLRRTPRSASRLPALRFSVPDCPEATNGRLAIPRAGRRGAVGAEVEQGAPLPW